MFDAKSTANLQSLIRQLHILVKSAQYLPCLVQSVVFVLDFLDYVKDQFAKALCNWHVIEHLCLLEYLLKVLDNLRHESDERLFEDLCCLAVDLDHFFSSVLFARDQL